jgi:putative transposase
MKMRRAYREEQGPSTRRTDWGRKSSRQEPTGEERQELRMRLPVLAEVEDLRAEVNRFAGEAGLRVMGALLSEEVEKRAGPRYVHGLDRPVRRWGWEEGYATWAGRKVPLRRPRLRDRQDREVPLERYGCFRSPQALQEDVARRVLAGVSTRNYEGVVEDLCEGYGIAKSSVSRHWKAASAEALAELAERSLAELDLVVLMIDGIGFGDYLFIVALGIDAEGRKHILGLWQGATENAEVCGGLLEDLIRRGLRVDRRYLFVLDGSKALAKAVRSRFGGEAPVQRCQVHKERNVLGHLPERRQGLVRRRLRAAWGMKGYGEARQALEALMKDLEAINPSAAASLEEGLEETLTLHRLGVPGWLRLTLRSTNPIESCFATTRTTCRNVKRWRTTDQAWRWAGTCLLEAEKRFKRVKGHQAMPVLLAALGRVVDSAKAAG